MLLPEVQEVSFITDGDLILHDTISSYFYFIRAVSKFTMPIVTLGAAITSCRGLPLSRIPPAIT